MSSRKKKRRSERKRRQPGRQGITAGLPEGSMVIHDAPGQAKMSEVLIDFIEPYSGEWKTLEDLKKLVGMATLAWNVALFPDSQRDEEFRMLLEKMPPDARPPVREILEQMIRRKLALFANYKRAILKYEVTMRPTGPYIQVMSTLDPEGLKE
jgi:hypothetical protein